MTRDEATRLANAIAGTWPNAKINPDLWREPLEALDLEQARDTYRHLRDTEEHAPTPARFKAQHRALHPRHDTTGPPSTGPGISFLDHLAIRIDQATTHGNDQAHAEVERWIAAANGTGIAAAVLGPRMRQTLADVLLGSEQHFTRLKGFEAAA